MQGLRILRKIRKEFDYDVYCQDNFDVKRTARSDEFRIPCPNCGDSKHKCYVNNDKKHFNCFKCNFNSGNYDVFDFVAVTEGIPRGKVVLRLMNEFAPVTPWSIEKIRAVAENEYYDVEEDEPGEPSPIQTIDSLPDGAYPMTSPAADGQGAFWKYIQGVRGFTEQEVRACQVHYVPKMNVPVTKVGGDGQEKYVGNIGRRVLFPVYGPGGLVSWLTRPISESVTGPKYINCPDSEINRTLWPYIEPHGSVAVLTEGIIDALAVHRLGPPFSAYCTFGKKVSYDQLKLLLGWGITSVILFWDPDARKDVVRAVDDLKMKFESVFVPNFEDWPEDMDAGDMLAHPEGTIYLEKALHEPIDVESLDFIKWQYGMA